MPGLMNATDVLENFVDDARDAQHSLYRTAFIALRCQEHVEIATLAMFGNIGHHTASDLFAFVRPAYRIQQLHAFIGNKNRSIGRRIANQLIH